MVAQRTQAEVMFAYTAMWKKKGDRNTTTGSYIARSVLSLLRILGDSEGITRENAEVLVVHMHTKDGKTLEVLAIEGTEDVKKSKPHIKLVAADTLPVLHGGYYYKAYPASLVEGIVYG